MIGERTNGKYQKMMTKTEEMVEILTNTFKCKNCKKDHEPTKLTPGEFNICTFCSGWGNPK